jgi:NosR/NirI family transcriptional regulator, nitrous oxide reductase regulator
MVNLIARYAGWLHTQWPAGLVEKLPRIQDDGATEVPGLYVAGDLTGVPLLKFSADTGAKVVQAIVTDPSWAKDRAGKSEGVEDLVILGAGVSGMSAALEARQQGISALLLEASEPFSTIENFPKGKPIYTYPTEMVPAGEMRFEAQVKEDLLTELRAQSLDRGVEWQQGRAECVERDKRFLRVRLPQGEDILALRVIVCIGRSGNYRKLGVPGEELPKVYNRLHDPKAYAGQHVLVVGGGDSAVEACIAMAEAGAHVTLSYRKAELTRPKHDNVERAEAMSHDLLSSGGSLELALQTQVKAIGQDQVILRRDEGERSLPNDSVLTLIGREAPLDFFRRSGVAIHGEGSARGWLAFGLFVLAMIWLYLWKGGTAISESFAPDAAGIQSVVSSWGEGIAGMAADPATLLGTILVSMATPAFWYTLLYTTAIGLFGIARIKRRKTPYVTLQTTVLFLFQFVPLFLLPELILPWMGYNGHLDSGVLGGIADELFPREGWSPGADYHPRQYWRAYGLILAWPLNVYNIFTTAPIWGWLAIGFVQTFVLIPILVYKWGKGAYCGWVCSCGALAETMGDTQRRKMPHGPFWNRVDMVGQVILAVAFLLLVLRIVGWILPDSFADRIFPTLLSGKPVGYKWVVDIFLGGIIGVGFYFKFSGRIWCRFACPLAALMHVYARFSRFRILPDKSKCISCNECTASCHQGIDVMAFANKGKPMEDPECVRCSACVQVCPTGTLQFGEIDPKTGQILRTDKLQASAVLMAESDASRS